MSKRPEAARVAAMTVAEMRTFADGVVSDVATFAPSNPKQPLADWPSLALQLALMVQRLEGELMVMRGESE